VKDRLFGIGLLALAGGAAACQDSNAAPLAVTEDHHNSNNNGNNPVTVNVTYDDFSNGATHSNRWFDVSAFLGVGEPEVLSSMSFADGKMTFEATPFVTSFDNALDHLKHLSMSTQSFAMPERGDLSVSADIDAETPGGTAFHRVPATGKILQESRQAAATLVLADAGDTGMRFMWWVSDMRAIAVYERAPLDGSCALGTSFTQILGEVNLRGRSNHHRNPVHNFAIRFKRNTSRGNSDSVEWIVDGNIRIRQRAVGIPDQGCGNHQPLFPAQGPGERLKDRLDSFNIGFGLASMVDSFPFNTCSTGNQSIPTDQRIYGQGASASYDNVKVKTVTRHPNGNQNGQHDDDDDD
jgi:hypothetical protein